MSLIRHFYKKRYRIPELIMVGRNYIETGRYLENIFLVMGVRFTSVNDQYDSYDRNDQANDIVISFKNLLNDVCRLSFSLKRRRVLFHRSTLKALEQPNNNNFTLLLKIIGLVKE